MKSTYKIDLVRVSFPGGIDQPITVPTIFKEGGKRHSKR